MSNYDKKGNTGLTLVEALVSTSIILVFVLALLATHNLYLRTAFSSGEVVKATKLAEEGLEVIKFIRSSSWSSGIASLSLETDYGLVWSAGTWQISETDFYIDGLFERKIRLSAVYRNLAGDIVSSGGTLDPETVLVISTVAWPTSSATSTKVLSTYLTNLSES